MGRWRGLEHSEIYSFGRLKPPVASMTIIINPLTCLDGPRTSDACEAIPDFADALKLHIAVGVDEDDVATMPAFTIHGTDIPRKIDPEHGSVSRRA